MKIADLMDRAKNHTGSDGATARTLGVSAQRLSNWRNRLRPCPLEVQVKLCALAEMSAHEVANHVLEAAGVTTRKLAATTAAFALALATSLETGFAGNAASHGTDLLTTMYRLFGLTARRAPC